MRRITLAALTAISLIAAMAPAVASTGQQEVCVKVRGEEITCVW